MNTRDLIWLGLIVGGALGSMLVGSLFFDSIVLGGPMRSLGLGLVLMLPAAAYQYPEVC